MIYKVIVAYDGWNYAGWQKQKNALGIQEVIEKALLKINKKPTLIVSSSRTDAHVHAKGQVFHFDANDRIAPKNYQSALNTLLPKDIRIQKVEVAPEGFHARFSAVSKCYEYICTYNSTDPFSYRYKQHVRKRLDVDAMIQASRYLLGEHDFTSFTSSRIDPRKPRVKTILNITLFEKDEELHALFEGTGFLRYQIRMMMGTLIEVGRHKVQPEAVKRILEGKNKYACRYNAQPHGLYLVKVNYD